MANIQQIINRIGTLKPKVFGIIDFTAGYHQTSLHPDSQEYTAFITQYRLFEWNIYIDDVLLFGATDSDYFGNTRKVLGRLREKNVTANPAKTSLGL